MPSPFPGMDPYLEAPDIWPDLHDALAGEIRHELNQALARALLRRPRDAPGAGDRRGAEGESAANHPRHRRGPPSRSLPGSRTAEAWRSLTRARREVSPHGSSSRSLTEPIRHLFVEIRDPSRGHKLITLIEILSPSNKRAGPDREAYESKQREVLESDASLIELDLLRGGRRILPDPASRR